jgi:hypothetical protein
VKETIVKNQKIPNNYPYQENSFLMSNPHKKILFSNRSKLVSASSNKLSKEIDSEKVKQGTLVSSQYLNSTEDFIISFSIERTSKYSEIQEVSLKENNNWIFPEPKLILIN